MENRALVYRSFGKPEAALKLETHETGPLQPGLVRVRMSMSPINPSDLIPITGAYSHRVTPPLVAGYEGVGTVAEAGSLSSCLVGKRVLPLRGSGTWQDHVDCDPAWVVPVPDDISDAIAARAYINPLAALLMTKRWNPAGRRVIVTAAGSTCAGLLAQWALASGAKEVVGLYRSPEHVAGMLRLGIVPASANDTPEIIALAERADLVFDAVGGVLATNILAALRKDASFVSYGLLSGTAYSSANHGPRPSRFHIRDQFDGLQPETWQAWFREIWTRLRWSNLPVIRGVPLNDWQEALALFREPGRSFKPVLVD